MTFAMIVLVALFSLVSVGLTQDPEKKCRSLFSPGVPTSIMYAGWKVVNTTVNIKCGAMKFSNGGTLVYSNGSVDYLTNFRAIFYNSATDQPKDYIMITIQRLRGKYLAKDRPPNFSVNSTNAGSLLSSAPKFCQLAVLVGITQAFGLYFCPYDASLQYLEGFYLVTPNGKPNADSVFIIKNINNNNNISLVNLHPMESTTCSV